MKMNFEDSRDTLLYSFEKIDWIEDSGIGEEELRTQISKIEDENPSKAIAKAKIL